MSKRGYISRYLLIIKKLKSKPFSSFDELQDYIDSQLQYVQIQDENLSVGFSKRTLQRDIKEIREVFGIGIAYSKAEKGYFIIQNQAENMNFQRMIEAFDVYNSLNLAQDLTSFIHLEQRRPQGTENLYGLLHSIKNRLIIKFEYQKFRKDDLSYRMTEPYALKEFRNRWYVITKDLQDDIIKRFALDRLMNLEITTQKFQYPTDFNVDELYQYSFGIDAPNADQPHEVILSFTPFQGKYIKTLPLHHTQETIIDDENELRIKLKLFITHDLIMELLSMGDNVKVIRPESLCQKIMQRHEQAFSQYSMTKSGQSKIYKRILKRTKEMLNEEEKDKTQPTTELTNQEQKNTKT